MAVVLHTYRSSVGTSWRKELIAFFLLNIDLSFNRKAFVWIAHGDMFCWNWIGRAEHCSVTSLFAYCVGEWASCLSVFNYNMKITGHTFLSLVAKVMEEQKEEVIAFLYSWFNNSTCTGAEGHSCLAGTVLAELNIYSSVTSLFAY